MNKEEIIEYIKHHIPIIIQFEDGGWCNANIKYENDILIVIPYFNALVEVNNTITINELLGLVKDKKAPRKIKYKDMIYHINLDYGDYESDIEVYRFGDCKEHYYLFEDINIFTCGEETVEILEGADDGYDKEEHAKIVKQLEKKYLGKKTPDDTEIIAVEVDYRKDHQYMNRVQDEYGNIFFVSELEEGDKQ